MNKIEFENASVVTPAKVTINGTDYEVTPAQLTTVENYLSAETLNDMQDNIEDAINGVVESGNNTNGSWVKYSDGTMICRKTFEKTSFLTTTSYSTSVQGINIYRSNPVTWTFPIDFIDTNYQIELTVNTGLNGSRFCLPRINGSTSATSAIIQLLGLEDFTQNATGYTNLNSVYAVAVGRWK